MLTDGITEYYHGFNGDFANIKALKTEAGGYAACDAVCKNAGYDCEDCRIADAITRLAKYEDTDLSPLDVTQLIDGLKDLKENGFCNSCGQRCHHRNHDITFCEDWEWRGAKKETCIRCGTPCEPSATQNGFPLCEACVDYAKSSEDEIEYIQGKR